MKHTNMRTFKIIYKGETIMNKLTDTFTLSNGVKIPVIGYGTWLEVQNRDNTSKEYVKTALKAGYRHIDTAFGTRLH